MEQSRHHDAEPDKFSVQALERRTVTNHQPFFDAGFKYICGSQAFFLDFQKDKVCICRIDLEDWKFF